MVRKNPHRADKVSYNPQSGCRNAKPQRKIPWHDNEKAEPDIRNASCYEVQPIYKETRKDTVEYARAKVDTIPSIHLPETGAMS